MKTITIAMTDQQSLALKKANFEATMQRNKLIFLLGLHAGDETCEWLESDQFDKVQKDYEVSYLKENLSQCGMIDLLLEKHVPGARAKFLEFGKVQVTLPDDCDVAFTADL